MRVLVASGMGAMLVLVPVGGFDGGTPAAASLDRPIAAVVAGPDGGFVLDRDGEVVRVASDGSTRVVASLGPQSTPFGTSVGGRVVFGGIRCEGRPCRARVAQVTVLSGEGRVEASLALRRVSGTRSRSVLDGLAPVGADEDTLWVAGGGTLFHVAVDPLQVVAEVPWPGGEPCLVEGVLYDLVPSGRAYVDQGAVLGSADAMFYLRMQAWDGDGWRPVRGGATSMAYGQNAYCSPTGYEVREGDVTSRRWEPGTGWRSATPVVQEWRPRPDWPGPIASSTRSRYVIGGDGVLLELTVGGSPRRTGVAIPGAGASDRPPAIQLDDSGGRLFVCATTYREEMGLTRCGGAPIQRDPAMDGEWPGPATPPRTVPPVFAVHQAPDGVPATVANATAGPPAPAPLWPEVHHYNLCSAACGGGVRAHSRDLVAWFVEQRRPAALSLNELCYDDSVHLSGRLPPGFGSGASYVAFAKATGCPGAVKQYGNQVRVRSGGISTPAATAAGVGPGRVAGGDAGAAEAGGLGPASRWWAQFPSQATGPCDHHEQECRGMVCAAAGTTVPGGPQGLGGSGPVFCSAHLESRRVSPKVAEVQADEYLAMVGDRHPDASAKVLAGDFNLEPPDLEPSFAAAGFLPATTGPTVGGHRPPASRQIDMVYYDVPASGSGPGGAGYCDVQASDHCYLVAGPSNLVV